MRRPDNMTQADFRDLRKKIKERDKAIMNGTLIFKSFPDLDAVRIQEEINKVQGKTVRFKGKVYRGQSNMGVQQEDKSEEE